MFNLLKKLIWSCAVILMVTLLISCSGGDGGTGASTGTLGIGLTDAPGEYLHVFVTINEVQVNKQGKEAGESGWITVLTPQQTYDLLELQNGVIADLGIAELEAGQYNQLRLILGNENYLTIERQEGEEVEELKVPSGQQTGIKIVHGFTIAANGATEITLDFDANKSVVQAGKSGNWLLKPTIKILETLNNSVSGNVIPAGANISAQIYDDTAEDPAGEVLVKGASTSDDNGDYLLYVPPATYNIVATMAGYKPECQVVAATPGYENYPAADIMLSTATATGTFTATVNGDTTANFSIRQLIDCGSGDVMVEVAWVSVSADSTSEEIILPEGSYDVVVSPAGESSYKVEGGIAIVADAETNVVYQPPAP